jgi:TRAP transporter TAXI family solute receptor
MRAKYFMVMVLGLCVFIAGSAVYVQAREPVVISAIMAPFGTGPYVINSAAEDMFKKYHPWLRLDHSESPGYVFNLIKLAKEPELRKSTIVGSGPVLNWMAGEGMKPFDKKYPSLKFMANFYILSPWLATLDPKIKTGKDLVGKKIALGRTPQVNWRIEPEAVIIHGWGIGDQVKIEHAGTKEAPKALLDGLVDAAVVGGYFDPYTMKMAYTPATLEFVASGRKIYFIHWGEEAVKKTIAKIGMPITPITLPADAMEGQKEAFEGFSDTSGWFASPEFPEELAYEFIKFVINNVTKFGEYAAIGKLMSKKALPFGWTPETIHPGALKAYKEAGIIK